MYFVRTGANDHNFDIRRDPGIVFRKKNTQNTTFIYVIETHESYSTVSEFAKNATSNLE
ncbi:hypothetical protein [Flavobacterium cellulosilyticum]|uniref:hypothetical protein n=1 Tax=Flavobacterium cellulosilyticum TaxID=2541731 RepID=UPI001404A419|nr:hypothetical protein [Flavobacterium cellulosilyticum]